MFKLFVLMIGLMAAGSASAAFVPPLAPRTCDTSDYCQSDIDFTATEAARRLGDTHLAYWIDGDTISIVARADGDDLRLCCTFQDSLIPLGQDTKGKLWGGAYRIPHMDQALISLVLPQSDGDYLTYRGPKAPEAPATVKTLRGRVTEVIFASRYLKADRKLVIYTPAAPPPPEGYPVIYMADGLSVNFYAHLVEKLIDDGEIRPVLLVGILNGDGPPLEGGQLDQRNREYLPNPKGMDDYLAHEAFVLSEVMPLAEKTYHASTRRQDRMTQGVSSGASWAFSFALRHPDLISQAAAFSIALEPDRFDFSSASSQVFYLEAGRFEDHFFTRTRADCEAANAAGAKCGFMALYAGHDTEAWNYALAETLKQTFAP